jgi:ABC-type lipoprotein release transport system permease subunit
MIVGNVLGFLTGTALAHTGIDLSALAEGMEFVGMSRVIYPIIQGKDVFLANLVVFLLGLLVSVYPAVIAARFNPVEAMAHN